MRDEEISAQAYSTIQETQLKYWERIRHPFVAGLELTPLCNLRCVHCYMGDYPINALLSTEQWKRIIDKLYEAGVFILYMTGGEILTRRDFLDIYVHAKKKGFIIELLTNITLLTDEMVEVFMQFPPATVSISIYGTNEDTYERVTGVKGSYRQFVAGVQKLKDADIDIELKFIGLKENYHDFKVAEQYANQMGAKFKYTFEIFPTLQGDRSGIQHRLSNQEIVAIESEHEHSARIYANNIRHDNPYANQDQVPLYTCNVASTLCYIDCQGFVSPCNKMRLKDHNLTNEDLQTIWKDYIQKYAHMLAPKDYKCAKCPNIHLCSPCPVVNYLYTGDYTTPNLETCELIQMRTNEFSKDKYQYLKA